MKQSTGFTVGGSNIKATLFGPETELVGKPAVVFVHGWASNEKNYFRRAQSLANVGFTCLTFDLRGQGASEGELGRFSRADHLEDVLAAYDFLAEQAGAGNKIGVCGISYGAYLGSIATSKRKISWLAMRVPALYADEGFTAPTAGLIDANPEVFAAHAGLTPANNRALKALSQYDGEVLLVQSGEDELIPKATYKTYLDYIRSPHLTHRVMEGADHSIFNEPMEREFIGILTDWFGAQIRRGNG